MEPRNSFKRERSRKLFSLVHYEPYISYLWTN